MYIVTLKYRSGWNDNTSTTVEFKYETKKQATDQFNALWEQMNERECMDEISSDWSIECVEQKFLFRVKGGI